ncbi:MAG: glycosyltransferase family 8 protein [Thermoleophilaceae bacterium]|nr:glycosyltransferase family 8 protein [Thermoleophilaceae bacterium]
MGSSLALVFASDEGFARPLAVAMHSALGHVSPTLAVEVYVLDNGIGNESRRRLRRAAAGREIRWIRVPPDRLVEHRGAEHFTSTSYARLLIPELLPRHVRRAVYLDGDVLVTGDLSPLFELELGNAPFAAVRDYAIGSTDRERPYFNAGVLAMDLERWRQTGLAERALAYADAQTEPLFWGDQDALNAVAESWHELDLRWNVQATVLRDIENTRTDLTDRLSRQRDDLCRTAAVLHFAGYHKPWIPRASPPATMRWARALRRSGWYGPGEYLRWIAPLLGKRAILAAGRRGRRRDRRRD